MKDIARILKYARPYARSLALALVCLLVSSSATLVLPLIVRNMINAVVVQKNPVLLNGLMFDAIVLIVFQAVFSVVHGYVFGFVSQRLTTDFRRDFFAHVQTLSMRFFHERRVGEIVSRLSNDIATIQDALATAPVAMFRQTITLIGGLAIILYLNWRLTGLILLILPPLMVFARFFGKRLRGLSGQVQDRLAQAVVVLEEVVSSIKIVKSYAREEHEQNRFDREMEKAFEAMTAKVRLGAFFGPAVLALTFFVSALLIWYGGRQMMSGATTAGELAAFFLYAIVIAGPIGTFIRLYAQIQETLGAVRRVFEILDTQPEIRAPEQPVPLDRVEGRLSFDRVSFAYRDDAPVLREVSFQLEPGRRVALVGPSGAGKSTIIQLLHRFFDPQSGAVRLDGRDIRGFDPQQYLQHIAYVPQETHLFGGTVRENILYGRLDAAEEEMVAAARAAHAHEFILELEAGYDSQVGEKGVKLSGGQRQRIAIARALLKNPKILVLDEATSSLDARSEALVQEALETLMASRTTLVVAHRLSTVHTADRILVLDRGRIVESGAHEELMRNGQLYYHLYTMKLLAADKPRES